MILSDSGSFAVRNSAKYDSAIATVRSFVGILIGRNVSIIWSGNVLASQYFLSRYSRKRVPSVVGGGSSLWISANISKDIRPNRWKIVLTIPTFLEYISQA